MSLTRTRFDHDVLQPASMMHQEAARAMLHALSLTSEAPDEKVMKASDVGRFVADRLLALGQKPEAAPVLSDGVSNEVGAFLKEFGVSCLHKLSDSVPVRLSGVSIEIDELFKWSDLSVEERNRLPHMYDGLPAVRIHFIPNEI